MVDKVTSTVSSIKQKNVDINEAEYTTAIVPVGKIIAAELKVDGVVVAVLGPWTSVAKKDMNALAQLRLKVVDNCEQKELNT